MQSIVPLIGRVLLASIFIMSGYGKLTAFTGTVAAIGGKGLPFPELLTIGAIVIELGGSAMLLLGWKTRWAAAALALFTALAALWFHNFWSLPPDQVKNNIIHFMKNIAIVGGFLQVVAFGAGTISLDAKAARS